METSICQHCRQPIHIAVADVGVYVHVSSQQIWCYPHPDTRHAVPDDSGRGWWNMPCWNGLSHDQQRRLIEHGNLEFGYRPEGECQNGAEVCIETMWDEAPGPRFYCQPCALLAVASPTLAGMKPYVTRTGKVLTDQDIEALADEAEQGYDVERLRSAPSRRRPKSPGVADVAGVPD